MDTQSNMVVRFQGTIFVFNLFTGEFFKTSHFSHTNFTNRIALTYTVLMREVSLAIQCPITLIKHTVTICYKNYNKVITNAVE